MSTEARSHKKTLANCVRECARDEQIISACNRMHGTHLAAPIEALLTPDRMPDPKSQAALELVCFIGFIHHNVWQRVLRDRRLRAWRAAAG